jgi:transposase
MCDALSRNASKEFQTILANCLSHGRRQFVDLAQDFPAECRHVLESLGEVYHYAAQARELNLSSEARLRFHQEHSQKVMDELQQWLGQAIHYRRNHWTALTLCLRQAGAPLDNNICERALKMAILHRKNSLGYKTQNGARLGDLFMSLIHTGRLCAANPLDYLNAMVRHAKQAREHPTRWFPWNYKQALRADDTG